MRHKEIIQLLQFSIIFVVIIWHNWDAIFYMNAETIGCIINEHYVF